ncbi:MAG: hypothetical protein Kow006_14280 [Gammaproteobacteria bacterium]
MPPIAALLSQLRVDKSALAPPFPVIEHPPSQPIYFRPAPPLFLPERRRGLLLRFQSQRPVAAGVWLELIIPVAGESCTVTGEVVDHQSTDEGYRIAVCITQRNSSFKLRMVEQLCHIAHYRASRIRQGGCELSEEQAAEEWILRHAASFPSLDWGSEEKADAGPTGPGAVPGSKPLQ